MAHSKNDRSLYDLLRKLQDLDKIIDFARARIQLGAMLFFMKNKEGTLDEIAIALRDRKKAVRDALIKLEKKGLIKKDSESKYRLTSRGEYFIHVLNEITHINEKGDLPDNKITSYEHYRRNNTDFRRLANQLVTMKYVYDAIVYIASSRKYSVSLFELADLFDLSPEVTESYISLFPDIFIKERRRDRVSLHLKRRKLKTLSVRLSRKGMSIYLMLPEYLKLKRSMFFKFSRLLTCSGHPRVIYKRMILLESLIIIILTSLFTFLFKLVTLISLLVIPLLFIIILLKI